MIVAFTISVSAHGTIVPDRAVVFVVPLHASAATSEGAAQIHGNVSVYDGFVMTDQVIDKHLTLPAGKNAILVGPVQVAAGIGITVEAGCTLLIA